jgi:3-oxoacyl-[acyl-carrier protein] reductase
MIQQRFGRIITITSIAGVAGNPGQANYSASKAGLIGLTKTAAKELASRNITVNAIAPGFIETEMTAPLPENVKSAMVSQIPMRRTGTPEDVARLTVFLASDEAGYITGQTIHVNGGMYI